MVQLVTSAPPTPNGGLHLGHVSGPYLAGDIYTRLRRLLGEEVIFVSYSDEYQDYLARKSLETNISLDAIQAINYDKITNDFDLLNIKYDNFSRTFEKSHHINTVTEHVNILSKYLKSMNDNVPYCQSCKLWGYEAFARGTCKCCGVSSDRSQCESCALPPEITGLENVKCTICGQNSEHIGLERTYFKLKKFINDISINYADINARKPLKNFISDIVSFNEIDWPIDRDKSVGYPFKDKKISTWFSGLAGYITSLREIRTDLKISDINKITFFVGFDCSFSHAMIYPSILHLLNFDIKNLSIFTNNFLKLDNADFSTSRGHAIWVNDFVNSKNSDYVRFYLSLNSPENESTNFNLDDYKSFEIELNNLIKGLDLQNKSEINLFLDFIKRHPEIFDQKNFSMKNYSNFVFDFIKNVYREKANYNPKFIYFLLKPIMPNLCK